LKIFS